MGSFTLDNLRLMYHLPEPQVIYNKQFIEKFAKENEDPADYTWTSSNNEGKVKKDNNGMYSTRLFFLIFFHSPCYVDSLANSIALNFPQNGCH